MGPILFADHISRVRGFHLFKNSVSPTFMRKCVEVAWQYRGIIYKPNLCVVIDILDCLFQIWNYKKNFVQ